MKLVMISGNPLQETFGGVEEHTYHLLRALSHIDDLNVHFITYGEDDAVFKRDDITVHSFRRRSANKRFYPFVMPYDVYRIIQEIKKINPDIVHFQGTHPLYSLAAVLCQRKYPTLLTVHGIITREFDFHPDANPLAKHLSVYTEKFALTSLENIIVVAPQIGEIVKTMTKANIFVIPNGIDPNIVQEVAPLSLDRDNIILFVGNLVKLKGVANLIHAVSLIKTEIPDVCLLVAGSGPQENELKDLVNTLLLQDNVKFLGFITGETKYSYFKSADVLAVPSLWESLPIVILEGMACGKPIVASNVGGIPYLIRDAENGYLVTPGAVEELAEKISNLLRDRPLREQMGRKNLERVRELTWDKIADMTCASYKHVMVGDGVQRCE